MSTDDRLERLLTEVLEAGTPTRPPDRLQPETLRALRHVRRWPRWLALVKEPPMRTSSSLAVGSPMARIAAIIVATLLLALMVAVAGVAGSRILADEDVRVVTLPDEIPEGTDWGIMETPIGQARWVHIGGDETMIPGRIGGLVSTSDGHAVLELASTPQKLWRSSDLISWTWKPVDIDAKNGSLNRVDGTYWLNASDPAGLWRSSDLETWQRLDLDRLSRPGANGHSWSLELESPLAHDGVVIVPFWWSPVGADEVPWVSGLGILDGDSLVDVRFPDDAENPGGLSVDDAGFLLYALGSDGLVHVQRSEDGRHWTEIDVIGDDPGEPTGVRWVSTAGGSVILDSGSDTWLSTNGSEWTATLTGISNRPVASGWVQGPWFHGDRPTGATEVTGPGNVLTRMWFQSRGGESIPFDIAEMAIPATGCSWHQDSLSPNTLVNYINADCRGSREMWIITFDEVPT